MVVTGAAFSSFWLGIHPLPPIVGVGIPFFRVVRCGLLVWCGNFRFSGQLCAVGAWRLTHSCGKLEEVTDQGQVRSISYNVAALLLFCVCVQMFLKIPRIPKQVVQKQSWTTYPQWRKYFFRCENIFSDVLKNNRTFKKNTKHVKKNVESD